MKEDLHAVREISKHIIEQKKAKQTTAEKLSNDWNAADTDEKKKDVIELAHKLAEASVMLGEDGRVLFSYRDRSLLLFHKEYCLGDIETFLSELAPARRLIDTRLDNPICFFLAEPYDKGLSKCEQVQSVPSGEIGKKPANELSFEVPYGLFRHISDSGISSYFFNELLKSLFFECSRERKADGSSLNASNDDLSSLGRFKGIRIRIY